MLGDLAVDLRSLKDYDDVPDIVEDGRTFFENALKKARTVAEWTGDVALADDSGLEVDHLGGAPGIYSSRYAGEGSTDECNIRKLLESLEGITAERRGAAFRCVLVLCRPDGTYESFEGRWRGRISEWPVGTNGFGYDPVFFLPERGVTVAQLDAEIKNRLSHRAQAFQKLKECLRQGFGT
jgi:XTP/dITP diphosphohydrolase